MIDLDQIAIRYEPEFEDTRDVLVVAIPCGCSIKIVPSVRNSIGTPVQFAFYCNSHFPF